MFQLFEEFELYSEDSAHVSEDSDDSGPAVGACFSSLRNSEEVCISEDSDDSGPIVGACFSSLKIQVAL